MAVVGAVGQLQFESFQFRLQDEYAAPTRIEAMGFERSRWIREEDIGNFSGYEMIVRDEKDKPVVLFKTEYRLLNFQQNNPDIPLYETPPE